MTLLLQPVRVATGSDEEGCLVFDADQRLLAVLVRLSEQHGEQAGRWFLETGFGSVNAIVNPTFPDLDAAQDWINRRVASMSKVRGGRLNLH